MIGVACRPVQFTHTHTRVRASGGVSQCVYLVCSFNAAAGSVHTPFGSNEIHGPDGKLAQQGEQTSNYVCKFLVGVLCTW